MKTKLIKIQHEVRPILGSQTSIGVVCGNIGDVFITGVSHFHLSTEIHMTNHGENI